MTSAVRYASASPWRVSSLRFSSGSRQSPRVIRSLCGGALTYGLTVGGRDRVLGEVIESSSSSAASAPNLATVASISARSRVRSSSATAQLDTCGRREVGNRWFGQQSLPRARQARKH